MKESLKYLLEAARSTEICIRQFFFRHSVVSVQRRLLGPRNATLLTAAFAKLVNSLKTLCQSTNAGEIFYFKYNQHSLIK